MDKKKRILSWIDLVAPGKGIIPGWLPYRSNNKKKDQYKQ
jgi:hypothetical protein